MSGGHLEIIHQNHKRQNVDDWCVTWWKVVGSLKCRLVSPWSVPPPTASSLSTCENKDVSGFSKNCCNWQVSPPGSFCTRLDESWVATEWAFRPCSLASQCAALWRHLRNQVVTMQWPWISVNVTHLTPCRRNKCWTLWRAALPLRKTKFQTLVSELWNFVFKTEFQLDHDITWPPIHSPSLLHLCRPGLGMRATSINPKSLLTFWYFL